MPGLTTVSAVHQSVPLQQLSIDYMPAELQAERLFTVVPVMHENDRYYIFDRIDAFRDIDARRADGTASKRIDISWTLGSYSVEEYALSTVITDRERRNQDNQLQLELTKTRKTQSVLLVGQEKRIAGIMANTANYASTNQVNVGATATNQWNNATFGGSIEAVMDGGKEVMRIQMGGITPNTLVFPKAVAMVVKKDTQIREIIKYTHSDLLVNGDLPPRLWNLDVVEPAASIATNNEGETETMGDLWGKHAWLLYRDGSVGLNGLTYGVIFRLGGGLQVKSWREEPVSSTVFETAYIQTEKVISPYAGYLMQNVIA